MTSSNQRYHKLVIAFHWIMFLLLVAVYSTMEFKGIFEKGTPARDLMKVAHFMMGITVLLLVVPRILARFFTSSPAIVPPISKYLQFVSKLMHLALYAFMILMPIMGWILVNSNGRDVIWFGLQLPRLIEENKEVAHQLHELHEQGAVVGYVLIGTHTLAALFHHYVMKNNVLLRMSLLTK